MPYAYRRRGAALSPQALALKQLNAESSPLLRLPGELRTRIYDLVLTSDNPLRLRVVAPPSIIYTFVPLATPVLRLIDDKKHMLALLSVCRQLQEEAYMVVFKNNVFEVVDKKGITVLEARPADIRYNLVGQPSRDRADTRMREQRYLGMYIGAGEVEEVQDEE